MVVIFLNFEPCFLFNKLVLFIFSRSLELPHKRLVDQDLPSRFHVDVHAAVQRSAADLGSSCDWMLSACTERSNRGWAAKPLEGDDPKAEVELDHWLDQQLHSVRTCEKLPKRRSTNKEEPILTRLTMDFPCRQCRMPLFQLRCGFFLRTEIPSRSDVSWGKKSSS